MRSVSSPLYRKSIAILLAMALLFAQGMGLLHNIAHAGWHHTHVNGAAADPHAAFDLALFGHAADDDDDEDGAGQAGHSDRHACAEYDAAAIAHGIHMHPPLLIATPSAHVLALWRAFASWDAPLIIGFSSRAPPAA